MHKAFFARLTGALFLCLLLCGCGSYGRGHYQAAPATYLHERPNVLTFVKWPSRTVLWRVQGGEAHGVRELARAGAHAWDDALEGLLAIREAGPGEAEDITIRLISNSALAHIDDPGAHHSPLTELFDALLPDLQEKTFLDYVPNDPEQHLSHAEVNVAFGLPGNRVREVTAHGMGHALGVRGHSPYEGDLMRAVVPHTATPSLRDVASLRGLYAAGRD